MKPQRPHLVKRSSRLAASVLSPRSPRRTSSTTNTISSANSGALNPKRAPTVTLAQKRAHAAWMIPAAESDAPSTKVSKGLRDLGLPQSTLVWFFSSKNGTDSPFSRAVLGTDWVTRRKSSIPGAGYGLFAKRNIPANTILFFPYEDPTGRGHGRININDLAFNLNGFKRDLKHVPFRDAWLHASKQYLQDMRSKHNLTEVRFLGRHRPRDDMLVYLANRDIRKGEELSVPYTLPVWTRLLDLTVPLNKGTALDWHFVLGHAAQFYISSAMKEELQRKRRQIATLHFGR